MSNIGPLFYADFRVSRKNIPQSIKDISFLPRVDINALTPDALAGYQANLEAFVLFVDHPEVSLRKIEDQTGVNRKSLYRLVMRVAHNVGGGQVLGLPGLIPNKHVKSYVRLAKVEASSRLNKTTAAGALTQLLEKHPRIREWLKLEAKKRVRPLRKDEYREVAKAPKKLHGQFLDKCREAGVQEDEWPFNQDYRGFRSFCTLLKKLEIEEKSGKRESQTDVSSQEPVPESWPIAIRPFTIVQFDGHKFDIRLTVADIDPFGLETLYELARIWILVISDVKSRAVLGYSIALGPEYNKDDFAEALQSAIGNHQPVKLTIPGITIKEGGGFPTHEQPELAFHRWNWLQFDEAKAHLAQDSLDRINRVLGTWTMAGRLGHPNDRAIKERFFGLLEEAGFHQLPGTYGSSPTDPRKQLGDVGKDLHRVMRIEELRQLVYVLLANFNGTAHDGVGGRTPMEAMRYFTSKPDFLLQTLSASKRTQLFLLYESVEVPIKGAKTVVHINFAGVRYTSDVLARKRELIGQKIRIFYVARDIRKVTAFFLDGSELGILTASKQWRVTPHTLKIRKEILRLKKLRQISIGASDDPVARYVEYKKKAAKHSKRAASQFARAEEGISLARQAEQDKRTALPTSREFPPTDSVEEADRLASEMARKPKKTKVTPTPMTLRKTMLF